MGLSEVIIKEMNGVKRIVYIGNRKNCDKVFSILQEYYKWSSEMIYIKDYLDIGTDQMYIQDCLDGKKRYGE